MDIRPVRCLLPDILRERKIEPIDFYTAMGWTKQQYSSYVTLRHVMSLITAMKVSNYLGVPVEELYKWKSSR